MQDFRKLNVWREAHAHLLKVRKATHRFPRSGYATVKKQLIGSTESIPFNIVEGCGASTQKEFARFLDISIKSSSECEYQLELVMDYGILPVLEWDQLARKTVIIRKMLCKLRARVLESLEETEEPDETKDAQQSDEPDECVED